VSDPVADIERSAAARFVRWDQDLWQQMLEGPATKLSGQLTTKETPLLLSYLRLVAEGIGAGLLVPSGIGASTFTTLAFCELLPEQLPSIPAARQASVLAACWNLGENLSKEPAWLERIFRRRMLSGVTLSNLSQEVEGISSQILGEPVGKLDSAGNVAWVDLATDDRRFLPGRMHWLAPTVLCVHDRLRTSRHGDAVCQGVWLSHEPLSLGRLQCDESMKGKRSSGGPLWRQTPEQDKRFTGTFFTIRNKWRAAAVLRTSQFLVTMTP
jgi:hypothetical protein